MKSFTEVIEAKLRTKAMEQASQELELLFSGFKDELDRLGISVPSQLNALMDAMRNERINKLLTDEFEKIASQFS